jgi:glycosyltransferase involved in cell wall biosynthesis
MSSGLVSARKDGENGAILGIIPDVSVVVPVRDEVESLPLLLEAIASCLNANQLSYEIICVDDGSSDGSGEFLKQHGQTAAMAAGFNYALGKIIVTLDADLQNDPADIPILLTKLEEGYDLVSGWRHKRQDAALSRLLPSKIANWLIGIITGVKLHDYGCSLKVYRAEVLADMNLYGELHRFLPALAYIEGARITEIPVRHHPRRFGQSKYGLSRTFRVMMDLLTISFMKKFLTKPMHVFGLLGLLSMVLGAIIGIYLTFLKLAWGQMIGNRPLLILAVLLLVTGVQLFCFGLLAELLMRTYHESQGRPIYRVREVIAKTVK